MLIVEADPDPVELTLAAGKLACPVCQGVLGPWGWSRGRWLRGRGGGCQRIRLRRSRCRACQVTHVLLPNLLLGRRLDVVEVIGAALLAKARGLGHRPIAGRLGLPASTVRGWLRRFAARAERIRVHFTRLAAWLDPGFGPVTPRGSPLADAVEAIGVASGATGGRLLCNTTTPFPAPW